MQPPAALIKKGITSLPCIGDGRQSGTSGSPSILNASPEAAAGGGLALLKTGDRVRIDLNKGTANILISKANWRSGARRWRSTAAIIIPPSQTPWQEIQRGMVDQLADGMVLKPAVKYQRVAQNERAAGQSLTRCHRDAHDASAGAAAPEGSCSGPGTRARCNRIRGINQSGRYAVDVRVTEE